MATAGSGLIASAGPFRALRFVQDAPYDDWKSYGLNATDGYFRDSKGESSWIQRPGFTNTNPSALIDSAHPTQGQTSFVDPSTSTIYRYFVANGKLYRCDSGYTTFTDVSPVGITIDASTVHVSFLAVGSSLVVTDGVNRPWVMAAFASTPVTGTYIDIDGGGGSWSTWGEPTIYQDSVMFITRTVPSGSAVEPRIGIVWCEPNQPLVGYTQSGYADFWNIIENGSEALYAILGTNNGLFYWREGSIGLASGTPSINFSTTATRDYKGEPVGSVSPWSIAIYNNTIFFVDPHGRPWMMPLDGDPQPIWLAAYTRLSTLTTTSTSAISQYVLGAIVPELNLYLMTAVSVDGYGVRMLAFSASDGTYQGMWQTHDTLGNFRSVQTLSEMLDSNGLRVLCMATDAASPSANGYVWLLNSILANVWKDTGDTFWGPTFATGYLSHSADDNLQPDTAVLLVRSADTIQKVFVGNGYNTNSGVVPAVTNVTPTTQVAPPAPSSTASQSSRAVIGLDGSVTRWVSFEIVGPLNPTMQWGVQRIEVYGSTSAAGPDDR
jgi:hypothetical protein